MFLWGCTTCVPFHRHTTKSAGRVSLHPKFGQTALANWLVWHPHPIAGRHQLVDGTTIWYPQCMAFDAVWQSYEQCCMKVACSLKWSAKHSMMRPRLWKWPISMHVVLSMLFPAALACVSMMVSSLGMRLLFIRLQSRSAAQLPSPGSICSKDWTVSHGIPGCESDLWVVVDPAWPVECPKMKRGCFMTDNVVVLLSSSFRIQAWASLKSFGNLALLLN